MNKLSLSGQIKKLFKPSRFDVAVEIHKKTLLKNRKQLWVNGKVCDIRLGKYLACCEGFEKGQLATEIFDNIESPKKPAGIMKLSSSMTGSSINVGWARGLHNNVKIRSIGRELLIMDNHNFAAPFIIDAVNSGIIGRGARMIHIDGHPDVSGWLMVSQFDGNEYIKMTPEQKFRYVVEKTTINNWQHGPLFSSGIVDADKWRWYFINPVNHRWYSQGSHFGPRYDKFDRLTPYENGGNDIVDIDIDFLYPLDVKLTLSQKQSVLRGIIPLVIKKRLNEVRLLAREAKVVTIATSPCYIYQPRAIVYAKWLAEQL